MAASENSDFDFSEWEDVLGAEPEKEFSKEKETDKKKDALGDDDDEEGWGDVIAIEVLENYCSNLMKQMEVFRKQGTLCDAVIVVDNNQELPVHKNVLSAISPFFKNIFSRLTSPEDSRITLRNLTRQIMDDILHFSYTGEVCIHDGNVRQLVATANFLQLQSLKDMAVAYLEQKLSPASAVEILLLADKHNCVTLVQSAEKLISDNFVIVSKTDGFKKLTFEMIHQLVQSEDIRVMKEEEVYEAVICWIKSNFGDRQEKEKQLPDLLHEIRLPLMSPSYLSEVVERDEMIWNNTICSEFVKECKNYHLPNADRLLLDAKLLRPRKFMGVVWGVLCIGGWQGDKPTKDVFAYLTSSFKWCPLTPLLKARYSHSVVCCDGFVYVLGGRDESTQLMSSVVRFDPSANKWQAVAPLPYAVASLGVCLFESQIYVVGGLSEIGSIDIVLRYSARKNAWQRVANVNIPRGASAIVADERFMYAIGGVRKSGVSLNATWEYLNTMEVYHRESNSWSFGPELLSKRAHSSAVCLNRKIYLIGGQAELLGISKGLDVYNTVTGEWFSTPYLGIPRSMSGIAVSETKFFVIGGITREGDCVNTVENYDTSKDRWTKVASLPIATGAIQCCTLQLRLAVLQGMTTSLSE